MQKKEKNFCCLCSKWKEERLTPVHLTRIEETNDVIMVEVCKLCGIVLHNIRRVVEERKEAGLKEMQRRSQNLIQVVRR